MLCIFGIKIIKADSTIDGQGNELTLTADGTLTVSGDSTLTLKDLILKGLSGERLIMEAPSSMLVLRDCKVILDGNYSLTQGNLQIKNDVTISGSTFTFAQTTSSDVTILANSKLLLDKNLTYSYDATPDVGESQDDTKSKLILTNKTSVLHLNACTLHSTNTGLKLQNGTLIVEDVCTFKSEADVDNEKSILDVSSLDIDVHAGGDLGLEGNYIDIS